MYTEMKIAKKFYGSLREHAMNTIDFEKIKIEKITYVTKVHTNVC